MEIRSYQSGDEVAIGSLFNIAFGKPMPAGFWEWRYRKNPFLDAPLIHLMWDGATLAGHYAISPVEMIIDGNRTMTALSMTTMTHPSYTGRGIFSTLAESVYTEAFERQGVDIVWGFPNANSHYGFIKNLSWKDIATIPFLTLHIPQRDAFLTDGYKVVKAFNEEKSKCILSDGHCSVRINKTLKYLTWRYFDNPSFKYEMVELNDAPKCFVVFKIFKSFSDPDTFEADILELVCEQADQCKELVKSLVTHSVRSGSPIVKVHAWESLFSRKHIWLEKLKFTVGSPVTFLGGRALREGSDRFFDMRNWEIGLGYSDVF